MPFSHLIGNDRAKNVLEKMLGSKTVPSTLLFCGSKGVGKSLFAQNFAAALMGDKSLTKVQARTHPDFHELLPVGKSRTHPIEQIRSLINEASLPPYEAPVKVFVIEDAHQMLPTSSNALLKTLEEPFDHSYFILVTDEPHALLSTIVSRARTIPFFPIPQQEICSFAQEQWNLSEAKAQRIAFLSHGSMQKAHELFSQKNSPYKENLMTLLSLDIEQDYPQFIKVASEIEKQADDTSLDPLFEEIVMWYRDLHLLKEGGGTEYLYHLDHINALKLALSRPLPSLERVLENIAKARLSSQRHIHLRHVLERFFS